MTSQSQSVFIGNRRYVRDVRDIQVGSDGKLFGFVWFVGLMWRVVQTGLREWRSH